MTEKQKLKVLIINAHGNPEKIKLGNGFVKEHLLNGTDFSLRITRKLDKQGLLLLACCRTGAMDGLAQEVSRRTDCVVAATSDYTVGFTFNSLPSTQEMSANIHFPALFMTTDSKFTFVSDGKWIVDNCAANYFKNGELIAEGNKTEAFIPNTRDLWEKRYLRQLDQLRTYPEPSKL